MTSIFVILLDSRAFSSFAHGFALEHGTVEMQSSRKQMIDDIAHVYVMPGLLIIGKTLFGAQGEHLGFANQFLNLCTLSTLPSVGFIYLKASTIADLLSIISLIPFCVRHANLHNPYSYPAMFYHAHIELPLCNALITGRLVKVKLQTIF